MASTSSNTYVPPPRTGKPGRPPKYHKDAEGKAITHYGDGTPIPKEAYKKRQSGNTQRTETPKPKPTPKLKVQRQPQTESGGSQALNPENPEAEESKSAEIRSRLSRQSTGWWASVSDRLSTLKPSRELYERYRKAFLVSKGTRYEAEKAAGIRKKWAQIVLERRMTDGTIESQDTVNSMKRKRVEQVNVVLEDGEPRRDSRSPTMPREDLQFEPVTFPGLPPRQVFTPLFQDTLLKEEPYPQPDETSDRSMAIRYCHITSANFTTSTLDIAFAANAAKEQGVILLRELDEKGFKLFSDEMYACSWSKHEGKGVQWTTHPEDVKQAAALFKERNRAGVDWFENVWSQYERDRQVEEEKRVLAEASRWMYPQEDLPAPELFGSGSYQSSFADHITDQPPNVGSHNLPKAFSAELLAPDDIWKDYSLEAMFTAEYEGVHSRMEFGS